MHAETIESACADMWPAVQERPLGRWRLRAAGGFTGRANTALVLGSPGMPTGAALKRVRAFYSGHGLAPKLQVIAGAAVEPELRALGWRTDPEHCGDSGVVVLLGPLSSGAVLGGVHPEPPRTWWPLTIGATGPDPAQRQVLTGYPRTGYGLIEDGDAALAVARAAVHGELLHIARLAVAPEQRRRGLAKGLLGALYRWGAEQGARHCVLQVDTANTAALRLYGGLGYHEHHRYRYWIPAAA
ncbi:GNAT family N-acetyltransferase [Sciscionella marina]|uniref:GNAT family N-acetyltransferase n=1 Tax=Sciscionella marina TaxID=508770 RepID=UPI00037E13E5|nr:GNAT family N-acetyltransferase [Sciscionella marina]